MPTSVFTIKNQDTMLNGHEINRSEIGKLVLVLTHRAVPVLLPHEATVVQLVRELAGLVEGHLVRVAAVGRVPLVAAVAPGQLCSVDK